MKLEACGGAADAVEINAARNGTGAGKKPFVAVFSESMEKAMGGVSLDFNGHVQGLSRISALQAVSLDRTALPRFDLWEMGIETLDTLEKYQRKLADVSFPLEGLTPLIDEIRDRQAGLCSRLEGAETDDGLAAVLAEVASLAVSEVERFQAGRY